MKLKALSKTKLIIAFAISIAFFALLLFTTLQKEKSISYRPVLTDSPIYIMMSDGDELSVKVSPAEDMDFSGLSLVAVNLNSSGDGVIKASLLDEENNIIEEAAIAENSISVGEWTDIPFNRDILLSGDNVYTLSLKALGCEPYLMYVPKAGIEHISFREEVYLNKENVNSAVSVGFYKNNASIEIKASEVILLVLGAMLVFLFLVMLLSDFKAAPLIFMGFIFIFSCVGIFTNAYENAICITSDSAGYLREATNMYAGNGFSYDGLAGYESWFANWPILYPAMICVMMLITGTDAYIASKVLSCILVLVILLVLYARFREKAWIYSLVVLNLGFIKLSYYTWSEIPFILFMLLFAFKLGDIVSDESKVGIKDYVLLGLFGVLTFLTRYFGIFVWFVVGFYLLIDLVKLIKAREKVLLINIFKLSATACVSGIACILYMMLNKLKNGMASGVSRSDWWDDYIELTKDLIDSLVKEVFNVFNIDTTNVIGHINYPIKTIFVLFIIAIITMAFVKSAKLFSKEGVFVMMGAIYYAMFIVIRYFSSMDTFYFRFFEPASFLISIGLVGMLIIKKDQFRVLSDGLIKAIAVVISLLLMFSIVSMLDERITKYSNNYYDIAKSEWDSVYKDIPNHSVVIFSDLDFRSSYYRPDVVEGVINTDDTMEALKNTYYGSDYMVIQRDYAQAMAESGEYTDDVTRILSEGYINSPEDNKYISIALR